MSLSPFGSLSNSLQQIGTKEYYRALPLSIVNANGVYVNSTSGLYVVYLRNTLNTDMTLSRMYLDQRLLDSNVTLQPGVIYSLNISVVGDFTATRFVHIAYNYTIPGINNAFVVNDSVRLYPFEIMAR
jgi:hypothetical protein